ncbi:hypothetical protein [Streptomyces sp. H27-C3]|uniref:hypothetical protein n=1 Tax=Streptomyces sp. H27-C3 TaxID=3046305 RepID=UPI0024B9D6B5|nr:hypothetical protein [Streptomyces sp. H27-C3]MDJ0465852.1 hypothetical protein [Streptomyces sp. H27-C3]
MTPSIVEDFAPSSHESHTRKAADGDLGELPALTRPARPSDGPQATVTLLSDWRLSHLPPDDRPLPSVAQYDQLLHRNSRPAESEKEGS